MPTETNRPLQIDDLLVVTIRVRVAAFPTHWERTADGGSYTHDNELAREICSQELEINLGAADDDAQELILVLHEMAEAVEKERLYGWMAQYRANLALGAGEIAPDTEAHLHPISHEIAASLKQGVASEVEGYTPGPGGANQGSRYSVDAAGNLSVQAAGETPRRPVDATPEAGGSPPESSEKPPAEGR